MTLLVAVGCPGHSSRNPSTRRPEPTYTRSREQLLAHGMVWSADQVRDRFNKVTTAEIRQAARFVFQRKNVSLALVSPLKHAPALDKLASPLN